MKASLVRLQALLPQHLLSRVVGWLSRLPLGPLARPVVGTYVRLFGVDLREASMANVGSYPTLNAFFTRALTPHARPLARDATRLVSPVDGTLQSHGRVERGRALQAKGVEYSLAALLGDADAAAALEGGSYVTVYLSPRDYHRVHMPMEGRIEHMRLIPGRLATVGATAARTVPGLFAGNERVVCEFDAAPAPLTLVLVGAMNVGSIETVWAGVVTPDQGRGARSWRYGDDGPLLARGAEMGRFNLGSTVILLLPAGSVTLDADLAPGRRLRMGEAIGTLAAAQPQVRYSEST